MDKSRNREVELITDMNNSAVSHPRWSKLNVVLVYLQSKKFMYVQKWCIFQKHNPLLLSHHITWEINMQVIYALRSVKTEQLIQFASICH